MPPRAEIRLLSVWLLLLCSAYVVALRPSAASAQSLPRSAEQFQVRSENPDSVFVLGHRLVAAGTDSVILNDSVTLGRGRDYFIDYRRGRIWLDSALVASIRGATPGPSVRVVYQFFPFNFQDSYQRRILMLSSDSLSRVDSIRVAKPVASFSMEDVFGPNLKKSGSIFRGFTVGSNRDLSLTSGLRLEMAGRIMSDIEITAALTDENTPIQPEGTTQTLQEFDKVFVEIRSTDLAATLGDFTLDFSGTEFARLSRKLQGAKGSAAYRLGDVRGEALVSGAVTRGKFVTKQFNGLEGVQGPYLLTGRNNERNIIVIAGTERVYVDGEQQTRGETNDYIIDYSTGEITFMTRRLITSVSRITVDFEYTDRQFSRSLFAAQNTAAFLGNRLRLSTSYFREADDPDAPIDFEISDSARAAIAAAGNDPSKAVLNGATYVDSNGTYMEIDTILVGGASARFYRYAPGNPLAHYNVTFSYVGPGKGDYNRLRAGLFEWKGQGAGAYLPIRQLPLPQLHELVDVALDTKLTEDFRAGGEYAHSSLDANRLSPIGDEHNGGSAVMFSAAYEPKAITLGGVNFGGMKIQAKERYVQAQFVPIDRADDIEFTRKWGVDSLATVNEEIQEFSLAYRPTTGVSVSGGYGRNHRGTLQDARRREGAFAVRGQGLPTATFNVEEISSTDAISDTRSDWTRRKGGVEYTVWNLTPGFRYEGERRDISAQSSDALRSGSLKFDAFTGYLNYKPPGVFSFQAELGWRSDDVFKDSAVVRESRSFTQAYSARVDGWNSFSTTFDFTHRTKSYSELFRLAGLQDIQTVLVRNHTRYSPFNRGVETDLYYEVATEQASSLERVYVQVTKGAGTYRYLGDINGNGLADESEFVLARFDGDFVAVTLPTDEMTPVIDLKTSARLRVVPSRFVDAKSTLGGILAPLSSETYVRVEEKSTERDLASIYLLHFSKFQQDATTLSGSTLFTQDLNVFEGSPLFSARLRYSQRRGVTNLSGGIEHAFVRERSIRLRWQLVPEIANQIDYVNRIDRASGISSSARLRDILSNGVTFDLSYRPQQIAELGFKLDMSRATDTHQTPELEANLNAQSVRMVYAFQGSGQARAELSREEVQLARPATTYPYELTGGRVPGKTWIWRLALDYRMTQFLQATMNYEGRTEGGATPVHTARAEVRAFF
jgi:hypothetical protein